MESSIIEVPISGTLPLDDRFAKRADPSLKPSHLRLRAKFVYSSGTVRVPERSSPYTKNLHHTIAAEVEIPKGGAESVLVCCGGIGVASAFS